MSEQQLPELALTDEEIDEILRSCNGRTLLVGGQALAFRATAVRRAVTIHFGDGARLQVLHPLDALASRLKNLAALPSKRDRQGIAEAQLTIDIARRYSEQVVREGRS